ncbi:MAG: rRNA (cytidine1402-2-O)-methyltransferase [Actinomycetota bacterium]|nr:rRNA (cytidine1402-2-O)-methyltransferase [Actinomycetota bacterium]
MPGSLTLCATPIGNLEDTSQRVIRVLEEADIVACEDTRRTRKLLTHFGIKARQLVTYNEGNERRKAAELVTHIGKGRRLVLVSDAGMPGLSDPGYRLVRACIEAGLPVDVIPGPNAAISALAISGLPPGRFVFEGFLPRKTSERRRHIETLKEEQRTLVFYESPHRVTDALADLAAGLGERPSALVRELTKMHQEVLRGTLPELATTAEERPPRGEIVLVVGGAVRGAREPVDPSELARRARALMDEGVERREAMAQVARKSGVPKREVFDALVEKGSSAT